MARLLSEMFAKWACDWLKDREMLPSHLDKVLPYSYTTVTLTQHELLSGIRNLVLNMCFGQKKMFLITIAFANGC